MKFFFLFFFFTFHHFPQGIPTWLTTTCYEFIYIQTISCYNIHWLIDPCQQKFFSHDKTQICQALISLTCFLFEMHCVDSDDLQLEFVTSRSTESSTIFHLCRLSVSVFCFHIFSLINSNHKTEKSIDAFQLILICLSLHFLIYINNFLSAFSFCSVCAAI